MRAPRDTAAGSPPPARGSGAAELTGALLARNTGFNLLGLGLPLLVALLAVPLLLAGLGAERFGLLALAWMFIAIFGEVGFARAATRFVAEALGGGRAGTLGRTVRVVLGAQAALGIVSWGVLAALSPWLTSAVFGVSGPLASEASRTFLLVAATVPAAMVGGVLRGLLEAVQRFGLVNAVRFGVSTATYLLPLLALWLGWGLAGMAALLLISRVGAAAAYGLLAVRVLPGAFSLAADRTAVPEGPSVGVLLRFGGWITASSVATHILVYMDRFLLGVLVSVAAVGVYVAPYELVTRLVLIPGSLAATLYPAFSTLQGMGRRREVGRLLARSSRYVLGTVGLAVVLLGAGAEPVLRFWLGGAYVPEAAAALKILGVGVLSSALALLPLSVLQGMGRADLAARIHLVQLPLYGALAWVVIGRWGVAGAAAAWTIRAVADAALMYLAAARVAPGFLRGEGRRLAVTGACLLVGGVAVRGCVRIAGSDPVALLVLVVSGALLMALMWRVSLPVEERTRIVGFLSGIRA